MTIEIKNLRRGTSHSTQEIHFTGGLRGFKSPDGWALVPASEDINSDALVFQTSNAHANFALNECGVIFLGICSKHGPDDFGLPIEFWEPHSLERGKAFNASDSWGAVAYQAEMAGDSEYSSCALYISVSLKVAGLRLRDISNHYHNQLNWALAKKTETGRWFSNAALFDLYADFHSLVSELSSARDYLSRLAAIHIGAPDKIDSLARLESWCEKPANRNFTQAPLISLLLTESGAEAEPKWLRRLGGIRNEMLHRVPMGANKAASGLVLIELRTSNGSIKTIRLAEPLRGRPLNEQIPDPFFELATISLQMERMFAAAWRIAKYPANPPHFVKNSVV